MPKFNTSLTSGPCSCIRDNAEVDVNLNVQLGIDFLNAQACWRSAQLCPSGWLRFFMRLGRHGLISRHPSRAFHLK